MAVLLAWALVLAGLYYVSLHFSIAWVVIIILVITIIKSSNRRGGW